MVETTLIQPVKITNLDLPESERTRVETPPLRYGLPQIYETFLIPKYWKRWILPGLYGNYDGYKSHPENSTKTLINYSWQKKSKNLIKFLN